MKKINKKTLRIGSYSIGLTAVAAAVVIVLNLLVSQLPASIIKPDITAGSLLTFGEETQKLVSGVEEEIQMYHICSEGYEDSYIVELLQRYAEQNSKITVETVDPVKKPAFVSQYTDETLTNNSVIVVSEKRNTVIDSGEFYLYEIAGYEGEYLTSDEYDNYAYYMYYYYGQSVSATPFFSGEKELTGAIDYVISDVLPVIYELTGHGETALSDTYQKYTATENVELKSLTLSSGDTASVPEDAEILFINAPASDITEDEYTALTAYLDNGGNIVLTTDFSVYSGETTPNLVKLTAYMGLEGTSDVVYENDTGHYYQLPFYNMPNIQSAGVVASIADSGYALYSLYSHPISSTDAENRSTSSLLTTSEDTYLYLAEDLENKDSLDGLEGAQYSIAYQSTITDSETGDTAGTLIWFGSPMFFDDSALSLGGANGILYSYMLSDMCEKTISINVAVKEITDATLNITEANVIVGFAAYVVIIPLAFLITGFVIWLVRRRK